MTDRTPDAAPEVPAQDEVERLIGLAGRRSRLPERDLAAARRVAHDAWQRSLRRASRRRLGRYGALAASVLLLVTLVVLQRELAPRPAPDPVTLAELVVSTGEVRITGTEGASSQISESTTIATGPHGRAALKLREGGALRLDVSSSVRFGPQQRLTLERGALYLDVATPHSTGAVAVETPFGTVRHLGTQFEVRLLEGAQEPSAASALRVTVREGRVAVDRGELAVEVPSGTELTIRGDGSLARSAASAQGPTWDWTHNVLPELEIEGRNLDSFLAWVARETGRPFRYAEGDLEEVARQTVLHGSIAGLTPEEALSVVLPGCGFDYHKREDHYLLERVGSR